jgi:tetratricopeptide (TPR) repeat protein
VRAEAFEQQERWHDAEREYAAALALDPALRFARTGRERSAARAALHDELEYHIAHPDRLSDDKVLEEARTALAEARDIEPTPQKLRRQMNRLQSAIEVATTPVRVLLVSDGLTNVVVYRVGRLGTFERRTLDLRPGTYTVVGTREGYRDVRRQLVVVAEGESKPLTVRCEEEI